MLAEQIGDAIARGGGRDAGLELMPQLNADGARQDAADQKHGAADQLKSEFAARVRRQKPAADTTSPSRAARGGDESGKRGHPEIKPQRRENDEEEIGQRRGKSQRLRRSHPVHMQIQHECRKAGFDQGGQIAPQRRDIAVHRQPPCDQMQHPQFEQQKRNDTPHTAEPDRTGRARRSASPDGATKKDHGQGRDQQRDRDDDRLDAQYLGQQDFAGQGVAEAGQAPASGHAVPGIAAAPSSRGFRVDGINATSAIASCGGFPMCRPANRWRGIVQTDR